MKLIPRGAADSRLYEYFTWPTSAGLHYFLLKMRKREHTCASRVWHLHLRMSRIQDLSLHPLRFLATSTMLSVNQVGCLTTLRLPVLGRREPVFSTGSRFYELWPAHWPLTLLQLA